MRKDEAMKLALDWAEAHGEIVFAGGGMDAINKMNSWVEAFAQPEQEPESECNPKDICAGCRCKYAAQPEQPAPQPEPVAHPFEDKSVISSLSWAAGLIEQAYRASGGHGADSWLMRYADKQGERIRQADHREWEKVNGRWQVKVTPPKRTWVGLTDDGTMFVTPRSQPEQEPVAEVKAKMTGGNVGISTVIHKIYSPHREALQPGDKLYTAPPQRKPLKFAGLSITEIRLPVGMTSRFESGALIIEADHGIKEQL